MPDILTSNTKDFADTKLYIEGSAADGLKPAEFMAKYPQFDKYNFESFCQSISCLQKAYKKKVKECSTCTCEFSLSHYFIL